MLIEVPMLIKILPNQETGSHFDSQTQNLWQNDTQFFHVRLSVYVESKEIFQMFYSYKTIGTLDDVKKQTLLALSICMVVMIILLNGVTEFRPPKFSKSSA